MNLAALKVLFSDLSGTCGRKALQKRLTLLKRTLEKLEPPIREQGRSRVETQGAKSDNPKDPPMKPAVVDSSSIAAAVQSHPIEKTSSWGSITKMYPDVKLFAIDADPRSFDVKETGSFDGRADILVSVPKKTRSGRKESLSLSIPARVFGQLSPEGRIRVHDFKSLSS